MSASEAQTEERGSLARSTAFMTVGTVISRVTGVVRLAVLAATLGVAETRFTDTYNLANTAPNILYELVLGGVVASVFVPVFVELIERRDKEEAWRAISGIFNVSLLVLTALSLLGVIAAPLLARFYASRLEGADLARQQEVLTYLLRIFIPQVILYGIYFMASAVLNAHKRFVLPMFTPILNNIVLIAILVAFQQLYGLVTLQNATSSQLLLIGLGTTASVAPMGLLLLPQFRKLGGYRLTFHIEPELRRKVLDLSVFVIGFVAANQLTYLVVQWLANGSQGGYTAFISANTFFLLPIGLFVWSITTALLPRLTRAALDKAWEPFNNTLAMGTRAIMFLMVPSTVLFIVLAEPMVESLLQHGVVTGRSTELVAGVLTFLVLGLVQFSLFQLYVRAFYAMQDARTPFYVNCAVVAVNTMINLPMYAWMGVRGLAAGQAIAYSVGIVLQARLLRTRTGGMQIRPLLRGAGRTLIASAGMAAVLWGSLEILEKLSPGTPALVRLLIPTVLGGAAFLGFALLLKIEEVTVVKDLVRRRAASANSEA